MIVVLGLVGCAYVSGLLSWGAAFIVCCMSGHCGRGIMTLPTFSRPPLPPHPTPRNTTPPAGTPSAVPSTAKQQPRVVAKTPAPTPTPTPSQQARDADDHGKTASGSGGYLHL